jgi:NAD(P)-dependent dehydrogenase (short-subunit alcohol dehydrogenase family)
LKSTDKFAAWWDFGLKKQSCSDATRNMDLDGKIALVTGSTDGVGRLVARQLAEQGARVLIHGRDHDRGKQLVDQIQTNGRGSAAFLRADFSSLAEVRRLAESVRQHGSSFLSIMRGLAPVGPPEDEKLVKTAMNCGLPSITWPVSYSLGCWCLS